MDKSKLIVVSGASKGIGKAICERFLAGGFHVVGCARNADTDGAAHPNFTFLSCDVTQAEQILAFAQEVKAKFGVPDVLVNNAGTYIPGSLLDEPDTALDFMLDVNLKSAYGLTRAFLREIVARKSGTIFNVGSTASFMPYVNGGAYCISKFGLLGFTETLREELKLHGIRVTAVLPGATRTASWDGTPLPDERFIRPEDVAEAIWACYALSPQTVVEKIVLRPQLGDIT